MPTEILEMTKTFMREPARILVKNEQLTLDGIKQYFIAIDKEEWKFDTLVELYNNIGKKTWFFWLFSHDFSLKNRNPAMYYLL